MDIFEAINKRRSVRQFTEKAIPESVIEEALHCATLAPNSSNTQTWNFYWVRSAESKKKLVEYCMSQAAARTAKELIVVAADPKLWRRSQPALIDYVNKVKAPKQILFYYEKFIPHVYRWGLFNSLAPLKWLIASLIGLFRPISRGPYTRRDIQEVAIKSAALAAENFVLAMTAHGFQTCMMEGFDERRVKRLLKMSCSERVVMVIGCGEESSRGTWGPRFRLPIDAVVKKI